MGCNCSGPCDCGDESAVITECDGVPVISQTMPIANGSRCEPRQENALMTRTPFYVQTENPACFENHCSDGNVELIGSLKADGSFGMPMVNTETADMKVCGVSQILVGAYLWNALYGYLRIVSFSLDSQLIQLKNEGQSGNAPVGTKVPDGTLFVLTGPPAGGTGSVLSNIYPYLTADFIAPNVSVPATMKVSNVNGLAVGKNFTVASGTYRLEAVIDSETITVVNDGQGVTPTTVVYAKNAATQQYQYQLIIIDVNPCTNEVVTDGKLLACKDGVTQPITGVSVGSVFVLADPVTGDGAFQVLQVPTRTCNALLEPIILTSGNPNATAKLGDTSVFIVGNVLQFGTRTDRFTVGSIVDANYMTGTFSPTPGTTSSIPAGTSACTIDCCEDNAANIGANRAASGTVASAAFAPVGLVQTDGTVLEGFDSDVIIVNDSPSKVMRVIMVTDFILRLVATGVAANYFKYQHAPRVGFGIGAIGTVPPPTLGDTAILDSQLIIAATQTEFKDSKTYTYTRAFQLNVGQEMRYKARNRVISKGGNVATGVGLTDLFAETAVISVAVQV